MIKSKLKVLPLVALLAFASLIEFKTLKNYTDDVLLRSGFQIEKSLQEKVREENLRALEGEEEYQKIIDWKMVIMTVILYIAVKLK